MDAIQILADCAASGLHLPAGAVCKVPGEVSAADADRLVRMGRAAVAGAAEDVVAPVAVAPTKTRSRGK